MGSKHLPKAERREQILRTAHRLFEAKGYHEARIDDIAEAAKLSKGTIYRFYSSKKELFVALADYLTSEFENEVDNLIEDYGHQPKKLILAICEALFTLLGGKNSPFRVAVRFALMAGEDKELRKIGEHFYNRWIEKIEIITKRGIKKAEFVNVRPRATALIIVLLLDGIILHALVRGHEPVAKDANIAIKQLLRLICK